MFQVELAEHLLVREYVYWNQVRINGSLFLSITTLLRCVVVGMLAQFSCIKHVLNGIGFML